MAIPAHLTFTTREDEFTVPLGDGPVLPTAGGAVFEETERAERTALTDFQGNELIRLDVPVFYDGWPHESVEARVNRLTQLWRGNDSQPPESFVARGPMPYSGLRYTMEPPEWLNIVRRRRDGEMVRVELTLHLVQWVRPDQIRVKHRKPKTRTIVLKTAMSCIEIAAHYLHDAAAGPLVARLNKIKDPRKKLKAGTRVILPIFHADVGPAQSFQMGLSQGQIAR